MRDYTQNICLYICYFLLLSYVTYERRKSLFWLKFPERERVPNGGRSMVAGGQSRELRANWEYK